MRGKGTDAREEESGDPETRELNLFRRLGYSIMPGDSFSYLLHLRPAEWPIMIAHTMVGLLLATGIPPMAGGVDWTRTIGGIAIWVLFLNGGTLAINSAYDDDEGDIGYLRAPPKPPRYLAHFAIALMALGQLGALLLGVPFAIAYAICFIMSLLYSIPPFRLKAVAGADWIINMWGFGTITPFAGWAITGRPIELWAALVFFAFCPLFAALYPLTQLYQFEEDQARGDRTLALVLGMEKSLQIAIAMTIIAFAILGAAMIIGPANRFWPTLTIPLAAWLIVLMPWMRNQARMRPEEHQRGMYAALRAWAITDIAVLLIFALR